MLVFISTFVSPHTLPFGIALTKYYDRVVFINTMPLTQERKRMGYEIDDGRVEIKNFFESSEECQMLIDTADDVILAGDAFELISSRIREGKRVYITHERIFKKGVIKILDPRTWLIFRFCRSVRDKAVYFLAIGDYAARDFRRLGFNEQKIYSFGYFPEVKSYTCEQIRKPDGKWRILWVGRFVDFKRPLMAIKAFSGMEQEFTLTMAGSGKLFSKAEAYAKKQGLSVEFVGNIPHEEVEKRMLDSHILLSTSDRGEGWGAVINEGMNCGCAVVCSEEIGCAGSLATKDNAVIFRTNSIDGLRWGLKEAARRQSELGQRGYCTVTEEFNAEIAAHRFVGLARENKEFCRGLCSRVF